MLKIILVVLASSFFIVNAPAQAQVQEPIEPVRTIEVSPSWVANGVRETTYASSSLHHMSEVNVSGFKSQTLCEQYVIDQELLAIKKSALGNAGKHVFSAACSKQR
jgi:hypothetical protein